MPVTSDHTQDQAPVDGMIGAREQLVYGWLLDHEDTSRKRTVEILVDGRSVGFARADRYQENLQAKFGGDGFYGFAFYYAGETDENGVPVAALEPETKTNLRFKSPPLIAQSKRSGPPLEIDGFKISEKMEILGRVGAYPGKDVVLEVWRANERLKTEIPVALGPKSRGAFSAEIPPDLLPDILSGHCEISLPGLKEAGLAVPLEKPVLAVVAYRDRKVSIDFSGGVEIGDQVPLTVRLSRANAEPTDFPVLISSNVVTVPVPIDFQFSDGSVQLLFDDVALPILMHHEPLQDLQFRSLSEADGPWRISDGMTAERAFFTFPGDLAGQLNLSGDIAHVRNESSASSIRLSQSIRPVPERGEPIVVVARTNRGAQLIVRVTDPTAPLCEASTTVHDDSSWHMLSVNPPEARAEADEFVFEVVAQGDGVKTLEVAIAGSLEDAVPAEPDPVNLISNPGLEIWPYGVGVREHITRGEIAAGWRLLNRDSTSPILTRAIQEPADSAFGLAIAAPQIVKWLRVEADLHSAAPLPTSVLVSFRAGMPPAARQLLAQLPSPIPQFMQIDRITLIRRTHLATQDTFTVRDEVIARAPRKIGFGYDVEKFVVPMSVDSQRELDDLADHNVVSETYHLAFEFHRNMVIGLFDVEVLSQAADIPVPETRLRLEDRTIEQQIPAISGLEAWLTETAARTHCAPQQRPPLKWKANASCQPVEIIIPVFNALSETLGCLESLATSTRIPILLRIIDDGSDESVRAALEKYQRDKPWVELHSLGQNRGYTYAADFGLRMAEADWVVLLNSDTILTKGWLEGLMACARSDPKIAFVGPLSNAASFQSVPELYSASGKWKVNSLPSGMTPDDMADIVRKVSSQSYPEVPLLNGFCTLFRRATVLELGGLNTGAFPTGYGEENDLCLRAVKAGYKLAVADDVYVYHVKSASFGNARREDLTKAGTSALRTLHPDVDLGALTKRFHDCLPLMTIREAVRRELAMRNSNVAGTSCSSEHEQPQASAAEPTRNQEAQQA